MSATVETVPSVDSLLFSIKTARAEIARVQNIIKQETTGLTAMLEFWQDREGETREQLEEHMRANAIVTVLGSGLMATATERKDMKIVDSDAASEALHEIGRYDECVKLDAAAVKKICKELGKSLPGVEATSTSYITIKEVEGKPALDESLPF